MAARSKQTILVVPSTITVAAKIDLLLSLTFSNHWVSELSLFIRTTTIFNGKRKRTVEAPRAVFSLKNIANERARVKNI